MMKKQPSDVSTVDNFSIGQVQNAEILFINYILWNFMILNRTGSCVDHENDGDRIICKCNISNKIITTQCVK